MASLGVLGFIGAVAHEVWPQRAQVAADVAEVFASPVPADAVLASLPASDRPVYRYSIVPGGAYSQSEVAEAIQNDPVVAAHYEAVNVASVHPTTVPAARAVYVSYRVGGQVFWTKNRVQLAAGETVLTDGDTEIRARCGNLVSDHARQPVAADEPPLAALDRTEPETGSSTIAGARDPEGRLGNVPDLSLLASNLASAGMEMPPGMPGAPTVPMWGGGGGGGSSPFMGSSTGTGGTSLVGPLGGSERTNRDGSGGGGSKEEVSNGGGSNGGGSNGGGSNGGGSNGGGSNGGGNDDPQPPAYYPPTTTGETGTTTTGETGTTTTGGTGTTTTGDAVDTTGGGGGTDTTGGSGTDTTGGGGSTDTTGGGGGTDTTGGKTVPEPGTLMLLTLGAIGAASRKLRGR